MASPRVSRAVARRAFTPDVRLTLVEDDLDEIDAGVSGLRTELHDSIEDLRKEVAATRQVLTGILVAIVVASIMLAINLAVTKVGG